MNVLVTGAAGAVGAAATTSLAMSGHFVVATDLPGTKIPIGTGIVQKHINLLGQSQANLKKLVRKFDCVIHTAADLRLGAREIDLYPLNVEVTRKLAQAASEEFFCKFVFISSGSIYAPSDTPIKETHRLKPFNNYERSKILAEEAIRRVADNAADDFSWAILRPALIYGPRARSLGATVAAIPPMLSHIGVTGFGIKGGPVTNWVHAKDVGRAAAFCATHKETDDRTFNVADDCPTPFGDTITDYIEAYQHQPAVKIRIPGPVLLRILRPLIDRKATFDLLNIPLSTIWNELTAKDSGIVYSKLTVNVEQQAAPYLFNNTVFDNSALKNLGFRYHHPNPKLAIPAVIEWYIKNGWIPENG